MFKNTFLITLFMLTMSCGYEPMYSKKNRIDGSNISIGKMTFIGDREINIKIKEILSNYSNIKEERNFILQIDSQSLKTTIGKDSKGDPSVFNLSIKTIIQVKREDDINSQIIFNESLKYNNIKDKFEIKTYEREVKRNLAQTIANNLIIKLSNY